MRPCPTRCSPWLLLAIIVAFCAAPRSVAAQHVPSSPPSGAPKRSADESSSGTPSNDPSPSHAEGVLIQSRDASLTVGAGIILWYHHSIRSGVDPDLQLFFARLMIDGRAGRWSLHIEPRFRDDRLRSYYSGPVHIQEAYAAARVADVTAKVGKIYSRLGLFWDSSFYGNIQMFDGLKLSPEYGISLEPELQASTGVSLTYALQYFVVDGRTNLSLPGRDTISVPGARRRHIMVARLDPQIRWRESMLRLGLSGQVFEADLPAEDNWVYRAAADLELVVGPFSAWSELLYQSGRNLPLYEVRSAEDTSSPAVRSLFSSSRTHRGQVGAQYTWERITCRANVSASAYRSTHTRELRMVPGVEVRASEQLKLLLEYAYYVRRVAGASAIVLDQSINVTIHAHY